MGETIDELKAEWIAIQAEGAILEQKVKALQHSAQFYAERNQQLIDENRELKGYIEAADRSISDLAEVQVKMNELLWWVTALANVHRPNGIPWEHYVGLLLPLHKMLATQGYTRENLEKRENGPPESLSNAVKMMQWTQDAMTKICGVFKK